MVRAPQPATATPDWKLPTVPGNDTPTRKEKGVIALPICANKVRNDPANGNQDLSTATQDSHHVHRDVAIKFGVVRFVVRA